MQAMLQETIAFYLLVVVLLNMLEPGADLLIFVFMQTLAAALASKSALRGRVSSQILRDGKRFFLRLIVVYCSNTCMYFKVSSNH